MQRLLFLSVLLGSTACFDLNGPSRGGQGEPCWTAPQDDPCDPGLQCRDGICRTATTDSVLPDDQAIPCTQSLDCAIDSACIEGSCAAYVVPCTIDENCRSDYYCSLERTCLKRAPRGLACVSASQCLTTFCVDGVCCDSNCVGTCESCRASKNAATDGLCSPIPADQDPDDECPGSTTCDGAVACALRSNGTACASSAECESSACADGVCCNAACDGPCRQCSANGMCQNIASAEDPGVCDDANISGACSVPPCVCDSTATCKSGGGVACTSSANCANNGPCVDGVCCDQPCSGQCLACVASQTGSPTGTCAPITVGTDPGNECGEAACNGNGACFSKTNGAACSVSYECQSGHCFNPYPAGTGYCCDRACNRLCESCAAADTGGLNGACGTANPGRPNYSSVDQCPARYNPNPVCNGGQTCIGGHGSQCRNSSTGAEDCRSGTCEPNSPPVCVSTPSGQMCGKCL